MATVDAGQVGQARTMVLRHIPKRLQSAFAGLAANILEVWQLADRAGEPDLADRALQTFTLLPKLVLT
eukprot:10484262-Prorocentrum_lima.AAC.1